MTVAPAAVFSSDLAAAALSCTALVRARRLAEWVGTGRTLTSSEVLRPADAVQACGDLGIELPGPRLRSALDAGELMRDWLTAVAAGFLAIEGRRASIAPGLPGADPTQPLDPGSVLSSWVQAAVALLPLDEDPCAGCLMVLHELHAAHGPLTMDRLAGAIAALEPEVAEGAPCPDCGEAHGPAGLAGLAGLADLAGGEDGEDSAGHAAGTVAGLVALGAAEPAAGAVRLTPLGTMLAESVIGGRAPAPDAGVATVVSVISELPPPVARAVAGPWLGARSAAEAVGEMLAFAESADSGRRAAVLGFARELGPEAGEAWREWAKRPGMGAYARQWLRSQGEEVPEDPADEAWLAVDALSVVLDTLAEVVPPFLVQAMLSTQAGEGPAGSAELMVESGHPRAGDVVAWLTGRRGPVQARRPGTGRSGSPGRPSSRRPARETRSTARGERAAVQEGTVYQLKITLRGVSKPPVWRRVLVPAGITLRELHEVILSAMGWDGGHLHVFSTGWQEYGSPDPGLGHASDREVRLPQLLSAPGDRLLYTYDFGDDWEHGIVLEETRAAVRGESYPSCVAGKGACPPEDCGGVWGYANLKEVLADPSHEDHHDVLDWLGLDEDDEFDPREFSVEDVNARLSRLSRTR